VPRVRCALVVELMFTFTLLVLRCADPFYSNRGKDVEIFRAGPLWTLRQR
jgi:hypothetical protein